MDDRYQYQPWYIKLWRRRHYIPIPWVAFKIWWKNSDTPWELAWSIAVGSAQILMKWHYTMDEIFKDEENEK